MESYRNDSLKKVSIYLEQLGLDHLIEKFMSEKFDETAVLNADDEVLRRYGIEAEGDLIRLRVLCQQGDTDSKKAELKNIIVSGRSRVIRNSPTENKRGKKKSRALYVSWKVYDRKSDRYVLVKRRRGGGCVKLDFSVDAEKDVVLKESIKHFWNARKDIAEGNLDDYFFHITDEKEEPVSDLITLSDGSKVPFTVGNFINAVKLPRPKLYLVTKKKSPQQRVLQHYERVTISDDDDDDDDDDNDFTPNSRRFRSRLLTSTPDNVNPTSTLPHETQVTSSNLQQQPPVTEVSLNTSQYSPFVVQPSEANLDITPQHGVSITDQQSPAQHRLIGTSDKRQILNVEIEKAFQESLKADLDKEGSTDSEYQIIAKIMENRRSLVKPEPKVTDDSVVVRVRHVTEGSITRMFFASQTMMDVYFWVGSLSSDPLYFQLTDCDNHVRYPEDRIKEGVYNMGAREENINMSRDGEVVFKEFASFAGESHSDDMETSQVELNGNIDDIANDAYKELNKLRLAAFDNLIDDSVFGNVYRENIFRSLIEFYSKKDAHLYREIKLCFEGEDAVGDGVVKDAFSLFFDYIAQDWEGCNAVIPPSTLNEQQLKIIGRIIKHGFILFQMFPVQISYASLKYILFGTVNESELLHSFYKHLPENEAALFNAPNLNVQACVDILSEYKIFSLPTVENITSLCTQAARTCMIRSPCYQLQKMGEEMDFFKKITPEMFKEIYKSAKPTAESVISALDTTENSNQEQRIVVYLHRYIRGCTQIELVRFVRFITASTSLSPKKVIKVVFINQPIDHLRPMSQTCFGILQIARQYSSFSKFRCNLSRYIQNNDSSTWALHDE